MAVLTIAAKDLRLLVRDRMALFWVLGFPVLFALLFGAVMASALDGADKTLDVVVVDDVDSPGSRTLLDALARAPALSVTRASAGEAKRQVRRGERLAFVRVVENNGILQLELGLDPTRASEGAALSTALQKSLVPPSGASQGGSIKTVSVGRSLQVKSFALAFPAALLWGLLGSSATFAVSMVAERTSGTELRLRTAPISGNTVLAGKALSCFVACLVGSTVLVMFGRFALGVAPSSWLSVLVSLLSIAGCFVGITLLLGMLGKTEQSVAGAGWATLILFAMIGGAMVPLSAMPAWLGAVSDVSPVKWGISALEGAYFREFTPGELLGPCVVLLGMGIMSAALGLELMARQKP